MITPQMSNADAGTTGQTEHNAKTLEHNVRLKTTHKQGGFAKLWRRTCVAVFAGLMLTSMYTALPSEQAVAATGYKFDFGNGVVQAGYTGVRAEDGYSAARGFGFNTPNNMRNVSASGSGVGSDSVQFLVYGIKSSNTFNVDLPNGLYNVKVMLGNTTRSSVAAEGVYQLINMTGNNAEDQFQIPITDGQLNLLVTEGKAGANFTLSALEITQLSTNPQTRPTIYIGGDSTVANYYPLDTSVQGGWGQMLQQYVNPSNYLVRNIASGGQIARGFLNDGQMEAILKYIKPGDLFIVQLGINDTNRKNNTTEAEFKQYMRDMIRQAKAKGATAILSTPQGRATDFNSAGVHDAKGRWYRSATVALAQEEQVPLVDLNVISSNYFTSIGQAATLDLYMDGDSLHPNRAGAIQLARLVSEELQRQGLLP